MELAKILADNLEYLKINNIEKEMGLKKTALVRMIARKEIPEKYKKQIEDWWIKWTVSLLHKKETVGVVIPKNDNITVNYEEPKNVPRETKNDAVELYYGVHVEKKMPKVPNIEHLTASAEENPTRTWVDIPPEQNEEFSKPIKKITAVIENDNIKKQIEAIRAETLPKHIITPLGKKTWNFDQQKRILGLEKINQ